MPYRNPLSFSMYFIETSGLIFPYHSLKLLVKHSLGRIDKLTMEFVPESELVKMIWSSRFMLITYFSLIGWGVVGGIVVPFVYFFLPRLLGGWCVNLYINTQHMCMQEDINDHRKSTRTINCNRLSKFLYWNMNYHIEHHIFPNVPFYSLPLLHERIKHEIPLAAGGVFNVNKEILRAIAYQKVEPNFNLSP